MPFEATLTDEERDRWVERAAREVVGRRLEVPAVLVVEMHRPLAFLGSQALLVATPFLGALVGPTNVLKFSKLLEDRRNLDRLLERIETLCAERDATAAGETRKEQAPDAG